MARAEPAAAPFPGPGDCGQIFEGALGTGAFVPPVSGGNSTGTPFDPVSHPDLEWVVAAGDPVFAGDTGVVVFVGEREGEAGAWVALDHGHGWQSAYGSLQSLAIDCGQSVIQGAVIGALGDGGGAAGAALHLELWHQGERVNPADYLQ